MRRTLGNILRLGVKELHSLRHDPILIVLILYAFSLGILAAAKGVPETLNKAPIAIVDEDRSPLSTRIASGFAEPYFMPPQLVDPSVADAGMDRGDYTFVLDIPPDFQADTLAGRQPAIQLNIDATRMGQAFSGGAYVQQIVQEEAAEFLAGTRDAPPQPIDLAIRSRFNPSLTQAWFQSVMDVINNVTMLAIVLTGAALIREREHGTVEHLLVMPVTPFEIMCSKVWSMGLVVLVGCSFALLAVVERVLAVPLAGSFALFMTGAALYLFATTAMGIVMATVARSMPQFGLLLMIVLLPLQMLSGAMTPREAMPEIVQDIMLLAPTTHFVRLAQAILFRGAGLDVVWPQLLAIAGLGALFFTGALLRFRRAIAAMA